MRTRRLLAWMLTIAPLTCAVAHARDTRLNTSPDLPPMDAPTGGRITFEDDFRTLNMARYDTTYAWGARWLNDGEQQAYVDPLYTGSSKSPLKLNPFSLFDGTLRIQAASPPADVAGNLQGQKYTSGILTTYHSFLQLYGYFEMQAKFPAGKGYWPAFWMIPRGTMATPPEIDIVEVLGDQLTSLFVTAHWNEQATPKSKGFAITVPDVSVNFHRYGALWTNTYIAWYFDGKRVAYVATPADLHSPMYLLLNLAVGGKWPGSPDSTTRLPGNMFVAHIRAYQFEAEAEPN